MSPHELLGNLPADRRRQRHHPQHHLRRRLALNQNPDQYAKLRANPALIPSMVSETIRWQTPLAHMRRTAHAGHRARRQDHQEGRQGRHVVRLGQPRRDGDRRPNDYIIDRERPRSAPLVRLRHPPLRGQPPRRDCSCTIIWEEILKRFPDRGGGRAEARLLDLREGLRDACRW